MSRIIIENKLLDGVPVNEYYIEDYIHKGLVFIQHGYRSTKERGADSLAIKIARCGFFVVAIDAYMHGERIEGPFIDGKESERLYHIPNIIRKTALDTIKIHKNFYKEYQNYDFIGISLGGMIAYYLSTKTSFIKKLIPVISTPNVTKQAITVLKKSGVNPDDFFTKETYSYLQYVDPINHKENFKFKELFILNGTKDEIVSTQDSSDYYNSLNMLNVEMKLYDVKHEVSKEMQKDIVEYLLKKRATN